MRQERNVEEINAMAKRMRLKALDLTFKSGKKGAHIGPALSCMEIMAVLYGNVLNVDAEVPGDVDRDRFISSKAHSVLAQYTALNEMGFISDEKLNTFQENGTQFGGHPVFNLEHGLEYTGGSLGMALSVGVGMALDAKLKGRTNKVYILVGDGELDEGSNWEAVLSAAQFKLDNLVVIVDKNGLQYDGLTSEIMNIDSLQDKFAAFNCKTNVVDGHNVRELLNIFHDLSDKCPHVVIAKTVKGKGVSFMENRREWHHSQLSQKQYEQAIEEVNGGRP